jgi:uncharacterized protein YukE
VNVTMPAGDPAALEQLAAALEAAAAGAGNLAAATGQVTADVRDRADWTGDAADAYSSFTANLTTGVGATRSPLTLIASAVRDYAGCLRVAQEKVTAYSGACRAAEASKSPADVTAASAAGRDAQLAVASQQAAGDQAAQQVSAATRQLADPFGPDGPVRSWIERIHAPWDSLAGDAAVARFLATVKSGEEIVEQGQELIKELPKAFDEAWEDLEYAVRANGGDEADLDEALLDLIDDFDAIRGFNAGWMKAGEELTEGATAVRGIALGSDALGIAGDIFTEIKPEDSGAMGWADRGVAAVNMGASGLDATYTTLAMLNMTTDEVPVAGEVTLIGTGLYLGGDYLYHHWTPFRDVAHDIGHATVSVAKGVWHGITSIF